MIKSLGGDIGNAQSNIPVILKSSNKEKRPNILKKENIIKRNNSAFSTPSRHRYPMHWT